MCYYKNNDEYEYYCYIGAAVITLYISCHNFVIRRPVCMKQQVIF